MVLDFDFKSQYFIVDDEKVFSSSNYVFQEHAHYLII